jgi:hypothetical protein
MAGLDQRLDHPRREAEEQQLLPADDAVLSPSQRSEYPVGM